jgi:hypothetical protein
MEKLSVVINKPCLFQFSTKMFSFHANKQTEILSMTDHFKKSSHKTSIEVSDHKMSAKNVCVNYAVKYNSCNCQFMCYFIKCQYLVYKIY